MWPVYNCVVCFPFNRATEVGNAFYCLTNCSRITVLLRWHPHHWMKCMLFETFRGHNIGNGRLVAWPHRSPDIMLPNVFLWGFVKNVVCKEMVQNIQGAEMHYACTYTECCWLCWTALGRRLNGVLMPAKQQNMNTWELYKIWLWTWKDYSS
jgi:hypothetical protein